MVYIAEGQLCRVQNLETIVRWVMVIVMLRFVHATSSSKVMAQ